MKYRTVAEKEKASPSLFLSYGRRKNMSLNLNYKPEAVVDISGLSREEWLDYRKKGIGGSDAAAIMGVSPFATKRDLFYDKQESVRLFRRMRITG